MTGVGVERPDPIPQGVAGQGSSAPSWEKYGLLSRPFRKGAGGDPRYASLPRPNRFRLALEEAGGLFPALGQFLAGRADVLPRPYLHQLLSTQIRRDSPPPPTLVPGIPDRVSNWKLLRQAPCSDVYAGTYRDRPIVVEFFHPQTNQLTGKSWNQFRARLRLLQDTAEASVAHPEVLEHFRDWLRLQADVERKRGILKNLQEIPEHCVTRFPRPLEEWNLATSLAYERMEGVPFREAFGPEATAAPDNLRRLTEALLEQALLLSLVVAEPQPESFLWLPDGHLGFRDLPALATVPVEWHYELLQYTASATAGSSHRAIQMLSRMCSSPNPYAAEQQLLQKLSSLQPELKINVTTPESVAALENYWRALAASSLRTPLFLELFHRNLTVVGQHSESLAAAPDVVLEALWPVLGRIVRFRLGEMLSTEKGREWLVGSGLLLLTGLRQAAITLEQVRDNDLGLLLEREAADSGEDHRNRRVASLIHVGLLLTVVLFSLAVAHSSASSSLRWGGSLAALFSAVVLCILVARIK